MQALPEFLQNDALRLIFFGGKGGVGKTTLACASALHFVTTHPGQKVLLVSTDPAHSLSDCLGLAVGDRVCSIPCVPPAFSCMRFPHPPPCMSHSAFPSPPDLFAWEPDARRLAEEFKINHREVLKKLAERGTYFNQQDITQFLDLSIPGVDEVMAILEIGRLLAKETYDRLIVDTAPTGHTVRMLRLPEQMLQWIDALDQMQEKHRIMAAHFTRKRAVKDECDAFIQSLLIDIMTVKKVLIDGEKTRFVPVSLAEPMVIEETVRLVAGLRALSIPVCEVLVNRVVQGQDCSFCRLRAEDQAVFLTTLERELTACELIPVPLFPNEIHGVPGLLELGQVLWGGKTLPLGPPGAPITGPIPPPLTFKEHPELILVGGKGGVGKTSVAAAIALYLARTDPTKKVLLFSTDPAHSLSDAFAIPIGNQITAVPIQEQGPQGERHIAENRVPDFAPCTAHCASHSNLLGMEINSDCLFQKLKEDFETDIREVFNRFFKSGFQARLDQKVMNNLIDFAPPGMDEIMALDTIMALKEQGDFDVLVLDTSPTGHLLRFLELPELVRQWLQAFFRLLIRYKGVVRLTRVAEKALNMAKGIRKIQEVLTDSRRTAFVAVTLAEGMVLQELADLMEVLKKARIPCHHIIVNRIIPDSVCPFCRSARSIQERYLKDTESRFATCSVIPVPHFPHVIQGVRNLHRLADALFLRLTGEHREVSDKPQ